jgi:hypothetical protein
MEISFTTMSGWGFKSIPNAAQAKGEKGISYPSMSRKLKADENFIPCRVDDGDELFQNGIFEFNVTRILEHIVKHPEDIALIEVDVGDFFPEHSTLNQSHVDSVDPSRPVVLAEISPGVYNLIDGHHRMEKARRLGIVKVRAHKLQARQHVAFLVSKRAYLSYVEYWNNKLEDNQSRAQRRGKPHR